MKPPITKDPMVSVAITLPYWVWRDLRDLAENRGTTKSKIVQTSLEDYLELQDQLKREQGE